MLVYATGYTTTASASTYNLKTLEGLNVISYVYNVKNPYNSELEDQMIAWCEKVIGPKYSNWNYRYVSVTRSASFSFYKKHHLLMFTLRWSELDRV